jgi:TonB family protein
MKKNILILLFSLIHLVSGAQSLQISGRVKDQYNNDIPYATISSKQKGIVVAVADRNGTFILKYILQKDTLICSHVGYVTNEERIEGNTIINFFLEKRSPNPYLINLIREGENVNPRNFTDYRMTPSLKGDFVTRVEISSSYPGGADKLQQFIKATVVIPDSIRQKKLSGAVKVGFTVERNGSITGETLIKGINAYYDEEVINAINKTKWTPAEQNGRVVKSYQEVVVFF